jgi:hypothetical protein
MKRSAILYSADEMRWLRANRMMIISDYHRAFVAEFGRDDVSAANLHALRKRMRWLVGREPGRFKGRHLKYTEAEIAWLRDHSTMEINTWCAAFREAFGRDDITPAKLHSMRKRMGWKTGRTGQFGPGHVPWTKGRKLPYNAGSARTQFKKGQLPHNYRGPGHESVDDEGYVWIIIDERNPWTGAATRRIHKHRWLWEQANGPVPDGYVLKCLGERSNTDPSNWELVPIGLLPRLNGKSGRDYDHAPAELRPTIMAVAKLEHAASGHISKSPDERTPT